MPTWERTFRFDRDWSKLPAADRERFRSAARDFVVDLGTGTFRPGLRVKGVQGAPGIFEMTWAPDGRATFQFGAGGRHGAHVIWRRIGRHAILGEP